MASGSVPQRLHFLVTLLSTDPPELFDVVGQPMPGGWCMDARDADGNPIREWYAPELTSEFLRMLNERASEN